jgi:hypothetical protein
MPQPTGDQPGSQAPDQTGKTGSSQPPISIKLGEDQGRSQPAVAGKYGGFGGPLINYLSLDLSALEPMTRDRDLPGFDAQMFAIGGIGGVAYSPKDSRGWWFFGGMGFGANQSKSDEVFGQERKAKLNLSGGGLFTEYHYQAGGRLDLAVGAMLGAGTLALEARGDDIGLGGDGSWKADGSFFMAFPYAGVGYEVMPWMRLQLTAGYLFMNTDLSGSDYIADSGLEMTDGNVPGGPQLSLAILFGWRPALTK